MIYIVVYDIESDSVRNDISKLLEEYGTRVQKSVFECKLEAGVYRDLFSKLEKIKLEDGNIRIYPLCYSCYKKAIGIGEAEAISGSKGFEII